MNSDEKKLLKLFGKLSAAQREALLAFAEFLSVREGGEESAEPVSAEPVEIPRPEDESVIAAIRRLSRSYHMLDAGQLFHETSALMTQHVTQGRPAEEVIDELETLFRTKYEGLVRDSEQ